MNDRTVFLAMIVGLNGGLRVLMNEGTFTVS